MNPEGVTNDLFMNPKSEYSEFKKISDGMLWHIRLGDASLSYYF